MIVRTHKETGWTRTAQGHGRWLITPRDNSGLRIVEFLSAGSWQNLPGDDRANINRDRVILVDGPPLPAWAIVWLETANARSCASGRRAFAAAIADADDNESRRVFGDY